MEQLKYIKNRIDFESNKHSISRTLHNKVDTSDISKTSVYISLYLKKKITDNNSIFEDKYLLDTISNLLYFELFIDQDIGDFVETYLSKERISSDHQLMAYIFNFINISNNFIDIKKGLVDSIYNVFLKGIQSEIVGIHSLNRLNGNKLGFSEPKNRIEIVRDNEKLKLSFNKAEKVLKLLNDDDEKIKIKQYIELRINHLIQGVF